MFSNTLFLHIPGLSCLWWLLLAMLIPLLLGLLLGYWLWQKYKKQAADMELERDKFHDRANEMEKANAELRYKNDELQKDNNALRASLNSVEADLAVLRTKYEQLQQGEGEEEATGQRGLGIVSAAAGETEINYPAIFSSDELQIIEGIGPKVEKLLKENDIHNWSALAKQSPEELKEILTAAGTGYKMMDPKTWPRQAELASKDKWDELVEYQRFLDAGREDKGDFETPAKVEVMGLRRMEDTPAVRAVGARGMGYAAMFPSDDLKIIEGVGPKLEEVLKNAGYTDWSALAKATPEELSEALEKADPNYRIHNPKTWPEQAKLASEGKWDELIEYQKFLDTGEEQKGDFETPSKVEQLAANMLGFANAEPEDLKIIEGIGPKIEELLKEHGIHNWLELSFTTADEIRDLLVEAGKNFRLADPSSWPQQARLAAAGHWKELKEFQDFLQGGKSPE